LSSVLNFMDQYFEIVYSLHFNPSYTFKANKSTQKLWFRLKSLVAIVTDL